VTDAAAAGQLEESAGRAYQAKRWAEAADGFGAAGWVYAADGDDINAAEMANNACVALLQAGEAKRALDVVQGTPEQFDRLGDPQRAAQAVGNLASALDACGRIDEAEQAYIGAADRFKALGETEARADTLKALSQLQLKRGRALDALSSMQQGLEGSQKLSLRERFLRWLARIPFRLLGG
jgi:tetratricopeptide (TPR) repeat protein